MKIIKVLNNNAVIAAGTQQEEVVVTGLGLAFQKKKGEELDDSKIERVFRMESKKVPARLMELIQEIPVEYLQISEDIISYAKTVVSGHLNDNIYLTLTDHIAFAIERSQKGYPLKNPMAWEIRRYYPEEYKIGVKALEMIKESLGILLPEDEAASITLHIVNSLLNEEMPDLMNTIKIVHDALNIIKYHFGIELAEEGIAYQRLVTHLKFFAQRIIIGERDHSVDDALFELIKKQYGTAYQCARKIEKYVRDQFEFEVSQSEMIYLTVHIERVVNVNQ